MNRINAIDQSFSHTDSLTKLGQLLTVAAFASTAELTPVQHREPPVWILFEQHDFSSFTRSDIGVSGALSATRDFERSMAQLISLLSKALAKHGLYPDRSSITGDGSRLLQFFKSPNVEGGIDIFPNGDVVVIIRKNDVSTIYETAPNDLENVPLLLKNAGVVS
jgi:hypothetical protein